MLNRRWQVGVVCFVDEVCDVTGWSRHGREKHRPGMSGDYICWQDDVSRHVPRVSALARANIQ